MTSLIVCHACDLVHRRNEIQANARVRCVRCRAELYRTNSSTADAAAALAVTAGVLLFLSNLYPLVVLQLNGSMTTTTLAGAALALYRQGYVPVAILVLLTTLVIPTFQISSLLYVLVPLRRRQGAPGRHAVARLLGHLRPWGMTEVFMLGALVALVKLSAMAEVVPGISLFSYAALMVTLAALTALVPTEQFWRWLAEDGA